MLAPIQACNALLDLALEYWKTLGLKSSHEKFKISILGLEFWLDWICLRMCGLDSLSKQNQTEYALCTSSSADMEIFLLNLRVKVTHPAACPGTGWGRRARRCTDASEGRQRTL